MSHHSYIKVGLSCLVIMLAVGVYLDTIPAGWACGRFALEVKLEVPPDRQIVAVAAGVEATIEQAESYLNASGGPHVTVDVVPWAPGQPFVVSVPCGSRTSLISGRRLWSWQWHALVVRLDFADGATEWLVREVPSRWEIRNIEVTVR